VNVFVDVAVLDFDGDAMAEVVVFVVESRSQAFASWHNATN
jgi:hypothetical protein